MMAHIICHIRNDGPHYMSYQKWWSTLYVISEMMVHIICHVRNDGPHYMSYQK